MYSYVLFSVFIIFPLLSPWASSLLLSITLNMSSSLDNPAPQLSPATQDMMQNARFAYISVTHQSPLEADLSPMAKEMTSAARRVAFRAKEKQRLEEMQQRKEMQQRTKQSTSQKSVPVTPNRNPVLATRYTANTYSVSPSTLLAICKTTNKRIVVKSRRDNSQANKENIPCGGLKAHPTVAVSGVRVRVRRVHEDLPR